MFIEIVLLVAILALLIRVVKKDHNYPPGPWGIPFFGSLIPLDSKGARKLFKKYGKIFMVKIGAVRFLYLADYEVSKEAFSLKEFSDRPKWRIMSSLKNGKMDHDFLGLITSNGERWQHNRRFVMRHLRDLGMGKTRLEGAISYEIEDLIKYFKTQIAEEPIEIPFALNISILNVIFQLIASHRYSLEDNYVKSFMKKVNDFQGEFVFQAAEDFFPLITYLFPKKLYDKLSGMEKTINIFEDFHNEIRPYIEEHKKTLDHSNPRDLLDDYLIAMEEAEKNKDEGSFFEECDLLRSIFDLFVAGNDTTANMTKWTLLYMAKYPSVQERVQKQIDMVVSRDCLPGLEHRNSLSIIDAVINEVSRMASFTSFGVLHAVSSDTNFRGYFIPKDTVVISLAFLNNEDPQYWENPEEFNPDRFLDDSGKCHMNKEGFQPFGIGRRQCLGESLARMELYLLTGALLQNFTFAPPPGEEVDLGTINVPMFNISKPQKMLIKHRK